MTDLSPAGAIPIGRQPALRTAAAEAQVSAA